MDAMDDLVASALKWLPRVNCPRVMRGESRGCCAFARRLPVLAEGPSALILSQHMTTFEPQWACEVVSTPCNPLATTTNSIATKALCCDETVCGGVLTRTAEDNTATLRTRAVLASCHPLLAAHHLAPHQQQPALYGHSDEPLCSARTVMKG